MIINNYDDTTSDERECNDNDDHVQLGMLGRVLYMGWRMEEGTRHPLASILILSVILDGSWSTAAPPTRPMILM